MSILHNKHQYRPVPISPTHQPYCPYYITHTTTDHHQSHQLTNPNVHTIQQTPLQTTTNVTRSPTLLSILYNTPLHITTNVTSSPTLLSIIHNTHNYRSLLSPTHQHYCPYYITHTTTDHHQYHQLTNPTVHTT